MGDTSAWVGIDGEWIAATLARMAGFEPGSAQPRQIAAAILGRDSVRLVPLALIADNSAVVSLIGGRWFISIPSDLSEFELSRCVAVGLVLALLEWLNVEPTTAVRAALVRASVDALMLSVPVPQQQTETAAC